jgi:hypothetical protein
MAPQGYGQARLNGGLHDAADLGRRRFSRRVDFGQTTPGWPPSVCTWCHFSTVSHVPCAFVLVHAHAVQRLASPVRGRTKHVAAASQAFADKGIDPTWTHVGGLSSGSSPTRSAASVIDGQIGPLRTDWLIRLVQNTSPRATDPWTSGSRSSANVPSHFPPRRHEYRPSTVAAGVAGTLAGLATVEVRLQAHGRQ